MPLTIESISGVVTKRFEEWPDLVVVGKVGREQGHGREKCRSDQIGPGFANFGRRLKRTSTVKRSSRIEKKP